MLSLLPGYNIRKPKSSKVNISHLFFADNLKTFAKNKNETTLHLVPITRSANDINMKFGLDKCAYIYIEREKRKSLGAKLTINNIDITQVAHNIFATPVFSPTFGILDWKKQDLENLNIKTRKIRTAGGSFYTNSDIDKLYC